MKRHFQHLLAPSVNTMGNYRVIVTGIFISFCLLFYMGTFAHGAELVAEVTAFEGDVIVLTDSKAVRVEMAGHPLNEGDLIQTKEGSTEVTFADGAIITISPYTTTRIQVKQEETGFWIFKTKGTVRRITSV